MSNRTLNVSNASNMGKLKIKILDPVYYNLGNSNYIRKTKILGY